MAEHDYLQSDPVRRAFLMSSADGNSIGSEEEWMSFMSFMAKSGMFLSEEDNNNVDKLWVEINATSNAFGRKQSPQVTFEQIQDHILEVYQPSGVNEIFDFISQIQKHGVHFVDLLHKWDINSLNATQLSQILQILTSLHNQNEENKAKIHEVHDYLSRLLLRLAIEGQLSQTSLGVHDIESFTNPIKWQRQNAEAVESAFMHSKVKSVRFPATGGGGAATVGPGEWGRCRPADDPYGLAQGYAGVGGIEVYKGKGLTDAGEEVGVVAVTWPRAGAPSAAGRVEALLQCYAGHRGLALAGGCVPRALGVDPAAGGGDRAAAYYQHAPARRLSALLAAGDRGGGGGGGGRRWGRRRRRLREGGPLFRLWARALLQLFTRFHQQCDVEMFTLPIEPSNILVAEQGLALRLGGLAWGRPLAGAVAAGRWRGAFRAREAALLASLAGLLRTLLGLEVEAAAAAGGGLRRLTLAQCQGPAAAGAAAAVEVAVGGALAVDLGRPRDLRARWHLPTVLAYEVEEGDHEEDDGGPPGPRRTGAVEVLLGGQPVAAGAGGSEEFLNVSSRDGKVWLELFAKREGYVKVELHCHRPRTARPPAPAAAFLVRVRPPPCSPALRALLDACDAAAAGGERGEEGAGAGAGGGLSLVQLLCHDYFAPLREEEAEKALDEYHEMFINDNSRDCL